MKFYGDDEELERALFALDLEEPPADLRSSILAATIHHVPVAAGLRPWEPWLYGGLCAALVWVLIAVIRGAAAPAVAAASAYGNDFVSFFSHPATLLWIALGGAATIWISQMNLTAAPGMERATRR